MVSVIIVFNREATFGEKLRSPIQTPLANPNDSTNAKGVVKLYFRD
jgi:hypothetical protein